MATRRSSTTKEKKTLTNVDSTASGEKEEKLQRSHQQRTSIVFSFLGVLAFFFLVAIVKIKHSPYGPNALRSHRKQQQDSVSSHNNNIMLPPNSIYRLSVEDGQGSPLSLEKFAGMVSLVVNVACK
mmetsp:Transcript_29166/g.44097  ORF Transcript_29166/g.44097 Transcript_29166/m.44097 type:complete len:126 (-) Transcript_29166:505-882(-)